MGAFQVTNNKSIDSLIGLTSPSSIFLEIQRIAVCGQTSICYRYSLCSGLIWALANADSALIALYDPDDLRADILVHELLTSMLKPIADAMANESAVLLTGRPVSISHASPVLLFWAC
jgi:hypothetical protein